MSRWKSLSLNIDLGIRFDFGADCHSRMGPMDVRRLRGPSLKRPQHKMCIYTGEVAIEDDRTMRSASKIRQAH
jgi:hypothetical protein